MARAKKAAAVKESRFGKPTVKSFDVIIRPIITEKTMKLMQEQNKVTVEVAKNANRTEIKLAFETVFQVKVEDVAIARVQAKQNVQAVMREQFPHTKSYRYFSGRPSIRFI